MSLVTLNIGSYNHWINIFCFFLNYISTVRTLVLLFREKLNPLSMLLTHNINVISGGS